RILGRPRISGVGHALLRRDRRGRARADRHANTASHAYAGVGRSWGGPARSELARVPAVDAGDLRALRVSPLSPGAGGRARAGPGRARERPADLRAQLRDQARGARTLPALAGAERRGAHAGVDERAR